MIFNQNNICIKIVRITEFIDNQSFFAFLSSVKIIEDNTKSTTYNTKKFSIMLPDKYTIDNTAKNSDIILIDGKYEDNDMFCVTVEKVDSYRNNITDKEFEYSFYEIIDDILYFIRFENKHKYTLSNDFKKNFKKGFVALNYMPQGDIFDIELHIKEGKEIVRFLENKSKTIELYNGGKIKMTGNPISFINTDDDIYYIADDAGKLYKISVPETKIMAEIQAHDAKINKIKRISGYLGTASDDGSIKLWQLVLSKEPFRLFKEINSHSGAVTCFDSKNMMIISGSKDKSIMINYEYGLYDLMLNIHTDEITEIQIINDSCFVSASKDKTLKFTNIYSQENFKTYDLKDTYVTCITPRNSGNYAGFGTSNGKIFILNKKTYEKIDIGNNEKAIKHIRFCKHGILIVNTDNEVKYYTINLYPFE